MAPAVEIKPSTTITRPAAAAAVIAPAIITISKPPNWRRTSNVRPAEVDGAIAARANRILQDLIFVIETQCRCARSRTDERFEIDAGQGVGNQGGGARVADADFAIADDADVFCAKCASTARPVSSAAAHSSIDIAGSRRAFLVPFAMRRSRRRSCGGNGSSIPASTSSTPTPAACARTLTPAVPAKTNLAISRVTTDG